MKILRCQRRDDGCETRVPAHILLWCKKHRGAYTSFAPDKGVVLVQVQAEGPNYARLAIVVNAPSLQVGMRSVRLGQ